MTRPCDRCGGSPFIARTAVEARAYRCRECDAVPPVGMAT